MRQQKSRPAIAETSDFDWAVLEDSSVVAAILVSIEGAILGANARMRGLLGIEQRDLAGRSFIDLLVDRENWPLWLQAQTASRALTTALRAPNRAVIALRGDVRALQRTTGRVLCGVFVDADDERLRAAAEQSARMEALGSLTVGIAHDFNNLLTVLVGNLYLVAEELRDRPKVFEKLKAARDAGKRGADLIKQLLTFARRERVAADVIDPCRVVEQLAPLLRRALGNRITLETELDAGGAIRASTAQFESVIVNLAVNARDAIDGKGKVSIIVRLAQVAPADAARLRLASGGQYVGVTVADNGGGIPAEMLGRVFEPFYSTKTDRGGTGLGLSMVRWFAEQAGGAVELRSVVGDGTSVTLWLPYAPERIVEANDKTMPLSTLPTGTERIVVLASDEALRSTIRQILEVLGYAVIFMAGADEMLGALRDADAQLLMLDGASGEDDELLAKAAAGRPQLKVIVTLDGTAPRERFDSRGIAVLVKPFSLADLAGTVRRTLDAAASRTART